MAYAACVVICAAIGASAAPAAENKTTPDFAIPDFSGNFTHVLDVKVNPAPDDGLPADPFVLPSPIGALPEGPAMNIRGESWQGDYHSPILKPWASAWVKLVAQRDASGHPITIPSNALCHTMGVLYTWGQVNDLQVLQKPDAIYLIFHRYVARVIHMNAHHPANIKPSSYGDSIGHWEGGTLVVDTIGLDGRAVADRYQTPTSPAMHIIERIGLRDGGKTLQVNFWVDDPQTFTHSWTSVSTYRRTRQTFTDITCQEGMMAGRP